MIISMNDYDDFDFPGARVEPKLCYHDALFQRTLGVDASIALPDGA